MSLVLPLSYLEPIQPGFTIDVSAYVQRQVTFEIERLFVSPRVARFFLLGALRVGPSVQDIALGWSPADVYSSVATKGAKITAERVGTGVYVTLPVRNIGRLAHSFFALIFGREAEAAKRPSTCTPSGWPR